MADDDDRTDVHQADLIYDDGVKQLAGDLRLFIDHWQYIYEKIYRFNSTPLVG